MSTRPITVIALVQAGIVVLGFISLGIALKLQGYPHAPLHWNSVSVMLRQKGMMLLVVPAGCVALALIAESQSRRYFNGGAVCVLSVILAAAMLVIFFYAVVFAASP